MYGIGGTSVLQELSTDSDHDPLCPHQLSLLPDVGTVAEQLTFVAPVPKSANGISILNSYTDEMRSAAPYTIITYYLIHLHDLHRNHPFIHSSIFKVMPLAVAYFQK